MRKLLVFICFMSTILAYSQNSKKPTLMLLPSDHWCSQRVYTQTFNNQGVKVVVPDYQVAFQQDDEIKGVVAKIGELLTDLNYSLKDCEQELKNLNVKQVEDNNTQSKGGAMLQEGPLDLLKRRTKTDIIVQIDWEINKVTKGKKSVVTFTLEAFDSYTNKRIATATGTEKASKDMVPTMLQKAVEKYIPNFDMQMTKFYKDQKSNGREIVLTVKKWDSWENDLETEYEGDELMDCIQNWLKENTVKGMFNLTDGTENFIRFEQVKIPLTDDNGNAMDARTFATKLRKYLQKPPFNITSKVMVRGLGEAIIVLGEK